MAQKRESLDLEKDSTVREDVKEYYGKILKKSSDLKSNACIAPAQPVPAYIRKALKAVHPDVTAKYYGCGLVVPQRLGSCSVLDLGCGSGRDCFMLSQLVGETGRVTGVDMTPDQLETARKYVDYHTEKFGLKRPNVEFCQGYIEDLKGAGLEEFSYDIIISNCVINLSPDKKRVLEEAYRVLKDGGELYFSDVYSSCPLPEEVRKHKVLWGECLGGALWWEELLRLAEEVGFRRLRLVAANAITVGNEELMGLLGNAKFVSATYRLFKISTSSSEDGCRVTYNGNFPGSEECFQFDCQHTFKVNEAVEVDGEVARILRHSRFSEEFTFQPRVATHRLLAGACRDGLKSDSVNPFELSQQIGTVNLLSATRGCCGTQGSCK